MRDIRGRRKEEKGASQGNTHCVRSKEHIGDNILKVFYYTNSGNLHFGTVMIISRWLGEKCKLKDLLGNCVSL